MKILDLDAVQSFVMVSALSSFTRAAEASGTTQSAVSLKLKRLEDFLGRRLIERTPRSVRLTAEGVTFLDHAKTLLAANERALSPEPATPRRLRLGISDHVAGPELPAMLARLNVADPSLVLDMSLGYSRPLLDSFDRGRLDAAIVRQEGSRRGGEMLANEEFGWFAAPSFEFIKGEPLRIASLAPPCAVRAVALRTLDSAHIPWVESFVGGGVSAVCAAVSAGFACAPIARRLAPAGTVDIGVTYKLPKLPRAKVMLYSRVSDARAKAALRTLAAAFRALAD